MQNEIIHSLKEKEYLPAAGKNWLLPLYDPLTRAFGLQALRKKLIDQSYLQPELCALEVGCGTGELLLTIKRLFPNMKVAGIDPDPAALRRAGKKARRSNFSVRFDRGFAGELPHLRDSFDRVFSCFMLHHLEPEEKQAAVHEFRRVLKPQGSLHLLDFVRLRQSREEQKNYANQVLQLMRNAGFTQASLISQERTLLGPAVWFKAS